MLKFPETKRYLLLYNNFNGMLKMILHRIQKCMMLTTNFTVI